MLYHLPHLPYSHTDLEPFLSSEQVDTHYFGHHNAYIEKVNKALSDTSAPETTLESIIKTKEGPLFNNGAQAWNHTFFWLGFTPKSDAPEAGGKLEAAIKKKFGSLDGFKERFTESALGVFGSGWTWLGMTPAGELELINTSNADNPIRGERAKPLWTCDVWEHAYYIDYRSGRKEFVGGALKHINWEFVEGNFDSAEIPNMTRLMTQGTPPSRPAKS